MQLVNRIGPAFKLGMLLFLLAVVGCSPAPMEKQAPTGHYEGTFTYEGAELRVFLDLRQDTTGTLYAELQAPAMPLLNRWFDGLAYKEGELHAKAGGMQVSLREEPNFLTGAMLLNDTLRAQALFIRRGNAVQRPFEVVQQQTNYPGTAPDSWLLQPIDTNATHPAIALLPDSAAGSVAFAWADMLVRQGFAVTFVAPTTQPADSITQTVAASMVRYLYRLPRVDTTRIGLWTIGRAGRGGALAAAGSKQAVPTFLVLQQAAFGPTDLPLLRRLTQRRVPVFGLCGAADSLLNVAESARHLRTAMGTRKGSSVNIYPAANRHLLLVSASGNDTIKLWPQLAAGAAEGISAWLKQQSGR